MWYTIKKMNICIMKSPKEKIERERGRKPVKEIIAENFLSLRRDMELQIYEAKVPPSRYSNEDSSLCTLGDYDVPG